MRSQLTEELLEKEKQIKALTTKVKNIEQVLGKLNSQIAQMPTVTREYGDIQRELSISTESLTRMLKIQESLEVENAQNTSNWKLISPPQLDETPTLPVAPHNLIFILIGAFTIGSASAVVVDKLDPAIQNIEQLKEILAQPIFGYIPSSQKFNLLKNHLRNTKQQNHESSFYESNVDAPCESFPFLANDHFYDLYSNISLLKGENKVISLVVSSAGIQTESSNISLNLAHTATALGKKVLLVDHNLRSPRIHQLLGIENSHGLTEILTDKVDLFSAIKKIPQNDSLSVITAGNITPDVIRLLLSAKMKKLMNQLSLSQQFDLIIYEAPSVTQFVDGKVIASQTDGIVLLVELGKTEENALKQVNEQLKTTKIPFLGMIVQS